MDKNPILRSNTINLLYNKKETKTPDLLLLPIYQNIKDKRKERLQKTKINKNVKNTKPQRYKGGPLFFFLYSSFPLTDIFKVDA